MDLPSVGGLIVKVEPGTQDECDRVIRSTYVEIEVSNIKEECLDYIHDMDLVTSRVGVIKSEQETIPDKESPILQLGTVKQLTEVASAIKNEPRTLASEENAPECGTCSEIDLDYRGIKNKCYVNPEKFNQSNEFISSKSSIITRHLKAKHAVTGSFSRPIYTNSDAIDLPDTDSETITMEPGTHGAGEGISHTHMDIDLQDVKKECLEYSERVAVPADHDENILKVSEPTRNNDPEAVETNLETSSRSVSNYLSSYESYLERRITEHSDEVFSCSQCTYSTSSKSHLKIHNVTHSIVQPFACSECNYSCNQKSYFKKHMFKHFGVALFSCSKCNYTSYEKASILRHFLIHSSVKPLSCSECSYSCIQKVSLLRHLRTHSGLKPFSCSFCSYSSYDKPGLIRHMRIHF